MIDQERRILAAGRRAPAYEAAKDVVLAFIRGKRSLWPCSILFKTTDIADGYEARFPLAADAAQWIKAVALRGHARFIDRALSLYRVHQNTTFATPVEVWRKENEELGEYAISELVKHSSSNDAAAEIRGAVRRLNVRITSEIINQTLRHKNAVALSQYWNQRASFKSPYGLAILLKGLISLYLPAPIRSRLRRTLYA
jgi:hypothetical protein